MTRKIEIKIDVDAPPTRVFDALTHADQLESWFAEKAYVSDAERLYSFWGRFTPEAPGPDSGRHRLLAFEPPAKLGFNWRVRGEETTVEIALDKTAEGTLMSLKHEAPGRPETELSLADFWLLSLENLRRWIKDGSAPIRCDYSTPPRGDVELTIDIESSSRDVFQSLIRPEPSMGRFDKKGVPI